MKSLSGTWGKAVEIGRAGKVVPASQVTAGEQSQTNKKGGPKAALENISAD
jgi:hypothetical protein